MNTIKIGWKRLLPMGKRNAIIINSIDRINIKLLSKWRHQVDKWRVHFKRLLNHFELEKNASNSQAIDRGIDASSIETGWITAKLTNQEKDQRNDMYKSNSVALERLEKRKTKLVRVVGECKRLYGNLLWWLWDSSLSLFFGALFLFSTVAGHLFVYNERAPKNLKLALSVQCVLYHFHFFHSIISISPMIWCHTKRLQQKHIVLYAWGPGKCTTKPTIEIEFRKFGSFRMGDGALSCVRWWYRNKSVAITMFRTIYWIF